MPDTTKLALTLGEGAFDSVAFADTTKSARFQYRITARSRLRWLTVGVRGGGGGVSTPGVYRVLGVTGDVPAGDITWQSTLVDEYPKDVQGRKFCDAIVSTSDLNGPALIPLGWNVNPGETCTVIVSPIVGNAAGAMTAAFLATCLLVGEEYGAEQVIPHI